MSEQYEGLLGVFPKGGEGLEKFFERVNWSADDLRAFLSTMRKTGEFEALFETEEVAGLLAAGDFFQVDGGGGGSRSAVCTRGRRKIRYRIREGGKQYIRSVLSDCYELTFEATRGIHHPHPVLRVFKDLADSYVWESIDEEAVVIEVGPNPTASVRRGVVKGKYYGLLPNVSAADLERKTSAVSSIRGSLKAGSFRPDQKTAAEDYLLGNVSDMFLRLRLQDVTIAADVLVALDAAYDVPLSDFVAAMDRCGAVDGYISMVTVPHPSLGVTTGKIGSTEMVFETDEGRYDFFFEGSSTRAYSHSKVVVDEYFMHAVREIVCGGVRYICAVRPISNEVVTVWHVYRAPGGVVGDASRPTYVKIGGPGRVVLATSAVDLRYPKGSSKRFASVKYDMGVETFSRALGVRLQDTTGSATGVYNHLRTNRSNVVYAGVLRSLDEQLPYDVLTGAAVAIDGFARQLEVSADEEMVDIRSTLKEGGWHVSDSAIVGALKNVRSKIVAAAVSGLDVPLVTIEVAKDVLVVPNEPMVLLGAKAVSFCRRAAVAADVARRYGKGAVSVVGLTDWYEASLRTCGCASCELRREEEETEKFFDCESECSVDESEIDEVFSGFDDESSQSSVETDIPEGVPESVVRSVVADGINVLEEQMVSKKAVARDFADQFARSGGFSLRKLQTYSDEKVQHYCVKVGSVGEITGVIGGGKLGSLGLVYDPRRGVFMRPKELGSMWMVDPEAYGDCYSNSALEVWIAPEVIQTARGALADSTFGREISSFKFVNGIWGAGKSFLAKEWFTNMLEEGRKPLYLCVSKDPMLEVRNELYGEDREGLDRVRTVGSAMVGRRRDVDVTDLVLDEAVMLHPMDVFVIQWKYKPDRMWLAGDIMQNEFCTFVAGLKAVYGTIVPFCDMVLLQEGHRCPKDVYAAGIKVYGRDSGIRPCLCHERPDESLVVDVVKSVQQLKVDGRVLTHLQRTKNEVRKMYVAGGKTISEAAALVTTGVEFQGGTAEEVRIVRDVVPEKKGTLFHELRRANVMISRSVGPTVYSTCSSEEDAIVTLINASKSEENREIVRNNMLRGGDSFGSKELVAFLEGTLREDHDAVVAGRKLKEKFLREYA